MNRCVVFVLYVDIKGVRRMAVLHKPTNIVHQGHKGGKTGCGVDTNFRPSHWENTSRQVNCKKDGCE